MPVPPARTLATALPILVALLAGCGAGPPAGPGGNAPDNALGATPHAVLAHLDTGINPYHVAFRWDSPLAWQHPSSYLATYPADAKPLRLSLDAPSHAAALEQDAKVWAEVEQGQLYYVPGTRIVGAITFEPGGVYCPQVPVPPANQVTPAGCKEHRILDDFGHGTMTASRMAGAAHALGNQTLIVSVEGQSLEALAWVAQSGFIDVVSNSWGSLLPTQAQQELAQAVREAARHNLWLFASGNGLGFLNGVAGQPTQASPTFPPGVLIVGAHDNGYATTWHGAPPHVVADGFGGWRASARNATEWSPSGEACCTSAAAPYAAGGAAAIVLEARRVLGDAGVGLRGQGDGAIVAQAGIGCGAGCRPEAGPLADGNLTLGELKQVLQRTAQPRPPVTPFDSDDGLANWASQPGSAPGNPWPGDNPYCLGCFTSPVPLQDAPEDADLVASIGYGAVNRESVQLASLVLRGQAPMPERPAEDAFFAADQEAREALFPPA